MAITNHELPSADDFVRMEDELFRRMERSHTRKVHRHRFAAVAAVALIAAGGSVAAGTVATPFMQANITYCYHGSDVASGYSEDTNGDDTTTPPGEPRFGADRITSAISDCAGIWQSGVFGTTIGHPSLRACIQDNLIVAVFVKDNEQSAAAFCEDQGMTAP